VANRSRKFIEALKEAGLPKAVFEYVTPTLAQMADRIADFQKRATA
jgi:hypothetical protein